MAGFRISINGHLDIWRLPPDGSLSPIVQQVFNVDSDSIAVVNNYIDERIKDIVLSGGMKVYDSPNHITVGKMNPWKTIPLHMIAYLSFTLEPMIGELPVYNSRTRTVEVASGKDIIKQ
jgi:hypothetical protein